MVAVLEEITDEVFELMKSMVSNQRNLQEFEYENVVEDFLSNGLDFVEDKKPVGVISIRPSSTIEAWFKVLLPEKVRKHQYIKIEDGDKIYLAKVVEIHHGSSFIAKARLLRQFEGGDITIVDTAPRTNSLVFEIEREELIALLNYPDFGINIGKSQATNIDILLNPNKLFGGHCFICGQTWSGKSYLTGVIIEEALELGIPTIVFDSWGEYENIAYPSDIGGKGYNVKSYLPKRDLKLNPYTTLRDPACVETLFNVGERSYAQASLLRSLLEEAGESKVHPINFFEWVKENLRKIGGRKGYFTNTIEGLEWKLTSLGSRLRIFGEGYKIEELVEPGKLTIINLKNISTEVASLFIGNILSSLIKARKRNQVKPCLVVIEEAHEFVPVESTPSSNKIRELVRGGRHVGIGVLIVTQRPSRVHPDVITICNTHLFFRLKGGDIDYVRKFASLDQDEIEEIKKLPNGICLVTGPILPENVLLEVRERNSKHGGESVRFISCERFSH